MTSNPLVYVVVGPDLRKAESWPKLRTVLRAKAKNGSLVTFEDLFPGGGKDYSENWEARSADLGGALVVAARNRLGLWLGRRAVAEAQHIADLGKPVLLFSADGLVPWPNVRLDWPDRHPSFHPAYVLGSAQRRTVIDRDGGRRVTTSKNLDPLDEPADQRQHITAAVV